MKTQLTATVAATLTLFLNSAPSTAAQPHWSAAIGTGHVSESTANTNSNVTHGAPASAHWAAAIGTGSASQNPVAQVTSPVPANQSVAGAHWASKIGTGQASESQVRAAKSSPAVVATTSSSTSP